MEERVLQDPTVAEMTEMLVGHYGEQKGSELVIMTALWDMASQYLRDVDAGKTSLISGYDRKFASLVTDSAAAILAFYGIVKGSQAPEDIVAKFASDYPLEVV